ncbi:hypothetical protein NBRC116592_32500 [Colwellia sp. KU-HH00111]|uniref:hypothetical protein n=1 Tax=Colwellia sp. KU-HH00111 TaxID=3127652 RepID=UPI0031076430
MQKVRANIYSTGLMITLVSLTCLSATAVADNELGLSLKGSTLGAGIELDYRINNRFNVRLQANGYNYDDDFEEDDISYVGELELSTQGLLLDWRPFAGNFRVTGGIYSNANQLTGTATDAGEQSYDIGNVEYFSNPDNPLRVDANVDLGKSSAGYLGLGWGNAMPSGWMFSVEVGVLLAGEPQVQIDASGSAQVYANGSYQVFDVSDTSNPLVQELNENIRAEEQNLADDISGFKAYPVIALGVGYRF